MFGTHCANFSYSMDSGCPSAPSPPPVPHKHPNCHATSHYTCHSSCHAPMPMCLASCSEGRGKRGQGKVSLFSCTDVTQTESVIIFLK